MRYIILFFCFIGIASVCSAESDRPDLELDIYQKPYIAKTIYREAWMVDNIPDLSAIAQLELMQAHTPDLDADTHKIADRGINTLKGIQFGSHNTDISNKAESFQKDPRTSLSQLAEQAQSNLTAVEVADTIEPSKRLNTKVDKQNKIGAKPYNIDIELFK